MSTSSQQTSVEDFKRAFLEEIEDGEPSSVEKGRRFVMTMARDLFDAPDDDPGRVLYVDGPKDGGIDLAYVVPAEELVSEENDPDLEINGDVWYVVQSKYGSISSGTLLAEATKMLGTLEQPETASLRDEVRDLVDTLRFFMDAAGDNDRLVITFWAVDPPTEIDSQTLQDIKVLASTRLDRLTRAQIDVEWHSVDDIFARIQDVPDDRVKVSIEGSFVHEARGADFHLGIVSLAKLHAFLEQYRAFTLNLDKIYTKNVRQYLGRSNNRVNKGIADTLEKSPNLFGLYNNGITIVADRVIEERTNNILQLWEPYIVNGCQTTRTIWDTINKEIRAGGTGGGKHPEATDQTWDTGVVSVKIVDASKMDSGGTDEGTPIGRITRYTNRQTAVRDQDFLALTGEAQNWGESFENAYGIYLEVQRGSWLSRKNQQQAVNFDGIRLESAINAFDLIQVYGAGWLGEPGDAYGRKTLFAPGGAQYHRIVESGDYPFGRRFDHVDLYAAYRLHQASVELGFGRGAVVPARRQTKFLFYFFVIELLRSALTNNRLPSDRSALSDAVVALVGAKGDIADPAPWRALIDSAVFEIDHYANLESGEPDAMPAEEEYLQNQNINTFLKQRLLGKLGGPKKLLDRLGGAKRDFNRTGSGGNSGKLISDAVRPAILPSESQT